MKILKLAILFIFFVSLKSEFIIHELNVLDGLIKGEINDIFQDDVGRIWCLTNIGISIFDGHEFNNYRFQKKYEIKNAIQGECVEGNICWILTDKGLLKLQNIGLVDYPKIDFFKKSKLNQLSVFDDKVWVSSDVGKNLYYLDSGEFKHVALSKKITDIVSIKKNENNDIWIFCKTSIWKLDKQKKISPVIINLFSLSKNFECQSVLKTNSGFLLSDNNQFKNLHINFEGNIENNSFNVQFDQGITSVDEQLIYLNQNKLYKYSNGKKIQLFGKNNFTCIFKDRANSIWLGKKNSICLIRQPNISIINPKVALQNFKKIKSGFVKNNKFIFTIDNQSETVFEYFNENFSKSSIPYFKKNYFLDNEYEYLERKDSTDILFNKINNSIIEIPKPFGEIQNVVKSNSNDKIITKTQAGFFLLNNKNWSKVIEYKSSSYVFTSHKDEILLIENDSLLKFNYAQKLDKYPIPNENYNSIILEDENLILIGENNYYNFDLRNNRIVENIFHSYRHLKIQSLKINNKVKWINCYNHIIAEGENYSDLFYLDNILINRNILIGQNIIYAFNDYSIIEIMVVEDNSFLNPYYYNFQDMDRINLDYTTDFPLEFKFFFPNYQYLGLNEYFYRIHNGELGELFTTKSNYFSIPKLKTKNNILEIYPKFGHKKIDHSLLEKTIVVDLPYYIKYNLINIGLFLLVTFLIIILIILYLKLIKNTKIDPLTDNSYINIFNKFSAYKKNSLGKLTKVTSTTQKEMLFYLIINGYQYKNGIDSEKFGTFFWPNLSHKRAKNRRNVTFSRIRHILGSKNYQVIGSKDNKCFINWDNNLLSIDLIKYFENIKKGRKQEKNGRIPEKVYYFENALDIYGIGITKEFSNIDYDRLCRGIHEDAILISNEIIEFYQTQNDIEGLLKICEQRILWDYLDVDIAQLKTNVLLDMGKKSEAKKYINSFSIVFQNEIGEIPSLEPKLVRLLI